MTRLIRISEPNSKLNARCLLADNKAPCSADFLWRLANSGLMFDSIHAMWTGPELSCPLPAHVLPGELAEIEIPMENATTFPKAGEIVLAYLTAGSIKGLPPGAFFDLGIFYEDGGRLLFPFGWLMANVCAEIVDSDLPAAQSSIKKIRNSGACKLNIEPA